MSAVGCANRCSCGRLFANNRRKPHLWVSCQVYTPAAVAGGKAWPKFHPAVAQDCGSIARARLMVQDHAGAVCRAGPSLTR